MKTPEQKVNEFVIKLSSEIFLTLMAKSDYIQDITTSIDIAEKFATILIDRNYFSDEDQPVRY